MYTSAKATLTCGETCRCWLCLQALSSGVVVGSVAAVAASLDSQVSLTGCGLRGPDLDPDAHGGSWESSLVSGLFGSARVLHACGEPRYRGYPKWPQDE